MLLSREDADRLIRDCESRQVKHASAHPWAKSVRAGCFYIIQLHPHALPNRLKVGYTDNLEVRVSDHRTTAPTLVVLGWWPCKRSWEAAATASITRDGCSHLGGEVYDAAAQGLIAQADAFFALMPDLSDELDV